MRRWSFDTETFLITGDNNAPAPVCCQWYSPDDGALFMSAPSDDTTKAMIAAPDHHFIGQNIAYDIVLMMRWEPWSIPYWIQALDEGRVHDTMLREQLKHLEEEGDQGFPFRCSLEMLAQKYLGLDLSADKRGDDIWRLKYGTLYGVPFDQWPAEAVQYGLDDVVHTWDVFERQGGVEGRYPTEELQVYASVVLQSASAWGFKTNPDRVEHYHQHMTAELARLDAEISAETKAWVEQCLGVDGDTFNLTGTGSSKNMTQVIQQAWRIKYAGIIQEFCAQSSIGCDMSHLWALPLDQDWKHVLGYYLENNQLSALPAIFWDAQQLNPAPFVKSLLATLPDIPRTKKGISTAEASLDPLFDIVPFLKKRAEYKHVEKMHATYVVPYRGKRAVHPRYTTVLTTGRVGCDRPNLQNIPKEFRDIVQPRPGYLFGVVDYSGIEMTTLAATIKERYGQSAMGEAISAGVDLHCKTAAMLMSDTYENVLEHKKEEPYASQRQGAKACYSADTELLTEQGWRRIDDLYFNDPNARILQADPHTREFSFTTPIGWVRKTNQSFIRFLNAYQDTLVTSTHRMLMLGPNGTVLETQAEDYMSDKAGYYGWAYNILSEEGIPFQLDDLVEEVQELKSEAFCPSVETSWVVTRRNGKAVVHGNCNFGLPGGLGARAFVAYAKATYGVEFSEDEARATIRKWKQAWPEVDKYLKDNGQAVDSQDGRRAMAWNNSGRLKANCIFTQYCNYPFQSLAADGAKASMVRIWREIMLSWFCEAFPQWAGYGSDLRGSPLRYSHLVNMVHDEIVCEHHESTAQEAYALQERYMVEEMSKFTNGITVRVEGQLSDKWVH